MYKGFYKRPNGWYYLVREDLKYLGFSLKTTLSSKINLSEDELGEGYGVTPRYKHHHEQAKLVVPKEFT